MKTVLRFFLLAAFVSTASAADLPRVKPEEVGFSSERLARIDTFYTERVNKGDLAGIVTLVARHGKVAHLGAVGYADVARKTKIEPDTVFRIYSMTKPVASVALMMLYEEGRFQLADPVAKYIPELANLRVLRAPDAALNDTVEAKRQPTIQDLLRHTAGFSHGLTTDAFDTAYADAGLFRPEITLKEMTERLGKFPLKHQPGTTFAYSLSPDIIARLVEVISGQTFDAFVQARLFKPLGMTDTGYAAPAKRLATVHWLKDGKLTPLDDKSGHPAGGFLVQPWSVNSYLTPAKRHGGSYGLVSTAADYWRFAQAMLNNGTLDGARILSPHTIRYMTEDHLGAIPSTPGITWGLGFGVVKTPAATGYLSSEGDYFWSGAARTHFWIDPANDVVGIFMTQHLQVPAADNIMSQMRAMVYAALLE